MRFDADSLGISIASARLLRDAIHDRLGLYYDEARLDQLADRLAPLAVQRGFGSLLDYYYLLKYDEQAADEWPRVMDALAVSETYFWREIDQVHAIADVVLPRLVEAARGAPVQIWSVPCSSGEEPLSIAMALDERGWFGRAPIRLIGSDASPAALAKARRGRYRERAFRSLDARRRERYFRKVDDLEWEVDPELHRRITWDCVNLLHGPDVERWGRSPIVFCRNVFIYFSEVSIARTVERLAELMPVPAYLCVGASESLLRVTRRFELQEIGGAFVYARPGAGEGREQTSAGSYGAA
jgi:chemotaxis protein methyltransferase CheR